MNPDRTITVIVITKLYLDEAANKIVVYLSRRNEWKIPLQWRVGRLRMPQLRVVLSGAPRKAPFEEKSQR